MRCSAPVPAVSLSGASKLADAEHRVERWVRASAKRETVSGPMDGRGSARSQPAVPTIGLTIYAFVANASVGFTLRRQSLLVTDHWMACD